MCCIGSCFIRIPHVEDGCFVNEIETVRYCHGKLVHDLSSDAHSQCCCHRLPGFVNLSHLIRYFNYEMIFIDAIIKHR